MYDDEVTTMDTHFLLYVHTFYDFYFIYIYTYIHLYTVFLQKI